METSQLFQEQFKLMYCDAISNLEAFCSSKFFVKRFLIGHTNQNPCKWLRK